MFNKIFEDYRNFLTEDEEALLVEGRKDVALSRATKGIDDEAFKDIASAQMERLLDADPSGKQKYANWLAGQVNKEVFRSIKYVKDQLRGDMMVADYIDSVRASVERTGRELARMLPTYHKLAERNLIDQKIESKIFDIDLSDSDFTHLHRGVTSPTQEKYIATGWFNFINAVELSQHLQSKK